MELLGVIREVDEPTMCCAGMVIVPKLDGNVCICVDLTKRTKRFVTRGTFFQSLAQLSGARIFSKLDANSGFWQVKLSNGSALLTIFITSFGKYCFNRLPFGITFTPEYFQNCMSQVLDGLKGVICLLDDVLVYGATQAEHNTNLEAVHPSVTLNREKCSFSQNSIKFLGHIIETSGFRPDPDTIKAIQILPEPNNVPELRRFLGMVSKFTSYIAEKGKPLRDLLNKMGQWLWGNSQ